MVPTDWPMLRARVDLAWPCAITHGSIDRVGTLVTTKLNSTVSLQETEEQVRVVSGQMLAEDNYQKTFHHAFVMQT